MTLESIKSTFAHSIAGALALSLDAVLPTISLSKTPQSHLTSTICFSLAKERKTSPSKLTEGLKVRSDLGVIMCENGYINLTLSDDTLASLIHPPHLRSSRRTKQAIVEFSSPNLGKPLHVGHLRGTIYGDAVSRLLDATGYTVARMNYPGDSGTQVAKLMYALEHYTDLPEPTDEKTMVQYYVKVSAEEESPAVKEEVRKIVESIEACEPTIQKRLAYVRDVSLRSFKRIYEKLDVSFTEFIGESQFISSSKERVEECVKAGIANKQDDGSILLELEPHGLPNTIIMRSNNTTLYLTRDLALADYKAEKYKPISLSLILTAAEQNLHFKQLFLTMKLLKRPYAERMAHVGFGSVTSTAGKFSTRKGNVILLEDVIDEVIELADAEIKSRNESSSKILASTIGLGSLKFAFLRISAEKPITFDPKQAVSFEGDTGAYTQYAYVRCKRILEKSDASINPDNSVAFTSQERELILLLSQYSDIVENAARNFAPYTLCNYLLKLSACFSSFYAVCRVNDAESKELIETRRALVHAVAETLQNGLYLLGVGVPEKM